MSIDRPGPNLPPEQSRRGFLKLILGLGNISSETARTAASVSAVEPLAVAAIEPAAIATAKRTESVIPSKLVDSSTSPAPETKPPSTNLQSTVEVNNPKPPEKISRRQFIRDSILAVLSGYLALKLRDSSGSSSRIQETLDTKPAPEKKELPPYSPAEILVLDWNRDVATNIEDEALIKPGEFERILNDKLVALGEQYFSPAELVDAMNADQDFLNYTGQTQTIDQLYGPDPLTWILKNKGEYLAAWYYFLAAHQSPGQASSDSVKSFAALTDSLPPQKTVSFLGDASITEDSFDFISDTDIKGEKKNYGIEIHPSGANLAGVVQKEIDKNPDFGKKGVVVLKVSPNEKNYYSTEPILHPNEPIMVNYSDNENYKNYWFVMTKAQEKKREDTDAYDFSLVDGKPTLTLSGANPNHEVITGFPEQDQVLAKTSLDELHSSWQKTAEAQDKGTRVEGAYQGANLEKNVQELIDLANKFPKTVFCVDAGADANFSSLANSGKKLPDNLIIVGRWDSSSMPDRQRPISGFGADIYLPESIPADKNQNRAEKDILQGEGATTLAPLVSSLLGLGIEVSEIKKMVSTFAQEKSFHADPKDPNSQKVSGLVLDFGSQTLQETIKKIKAASPKFYFLTLIY